MELLTVRDLERESKVSRHTWRTWIREKKLPVLRLGRTVRVARADLDKFLAAAREAQR